MKFKKTENLHIMFWILKDLFWVAELKLFATVMIVPTIGLGILLTVKMRQKYEDLMHNLTVVSWICANVSWMLGDFYFHDQLRPLAICFFLIGLLLLAWYYVPMLVRRFFHRAD